ncbi:MAG: hypothetical protein GY765_31105 [bacterium]|nr:hypothetical protein [bacterium]
MIKHLLIVLLCVPAILLPAGKVGTIKVEKVIGDPEINEDVFFSSEVSDIFVDRTNDTICVVDPKFHHIKVFNAEGKLVKTVGREGQGPNEFHGPHSLTKINGQYAVTDPGQLRIQFYDHKWNPTKIIRTKLRVAALIPTGKDAFWTTPNKGPRVHMTFGDKKPEKVQPVMFKIKGDGRTMNTMGSSPMDKNAYLGEMLRNVVLLQGPEQSVILLYTITGKIEVYQKETLAKTLQIKLKYKPVHPEGVQEVKGDTIYMKLTMDRILTDACWGPDNKLYAAVYQAHTSGQKKEDPPVPMHLSTIDITTGGILKEWRLEGTISAVDFLSDGRAVLLIADSDGEFTVVIGRLN